MKFDAIQDRATLRFIPAQERPVPARKADAPSSTGWMQHIRGWLHAWAERRRERALLAGLARLDDATLRDLGIRRSEFGSIGAESLGHTEPTRLRIVLSNGEVFGGPRKSIGADYYR